MSVQLAAGVFSFLLVCIGIIIFRLEKKEKETTKLKSFLADSRRELAALEILKTNFLGRIGEVLVTPLKAIETSSTKLADVEMEISLEIRNNLTNLSEDVRSLLRILDVFEEISEKRKPNSEDNPESIVKTIQVDDLVSEAAMEIADDAADKMISLSVVIGGSAKVAGKKNQLFEAILSILREALKKADSGTVLLIELKVQKNIEIEINWFSEEQEIFEEQDLLGSGFVRLVASSHGGWVTLDWERRQISLILPLAGENT